jgi:para-nitrobenzyl esterase
MKKHIAFCILFPIVYILLSLLTLLYLDLANGPMYLLFIEIALMIAFLVSSILLINKRTILRAIPFILFIGLSLFICGVSRPITKTRKAMEGKNISETEVLTLKNGKVKGLYDPDKEVEVYAGIPYAKPPVGELRWKEPVPIDNWDGVLDCTNFAPMSMQNYGNPVMSTVVEMYAEKGWHPDYKMYPNEPRSEDSLYLNIWKPRGATENLPILVYIHGGSLTSGRSSYDD